MTRWHYTLTGSKFSDWIMNWGWLLFILLLIIGFVVYYFTQVPAECFVVHCVRAIQ